MNLKQRMFTIGVLLVLLFGFNFLYASADFRTYPEESEIVTDPVAYEGEQVFVFSDVKSINEEQGSIVVTREEKRVTDIGLNGITKEFEYQEDVTVRLEKASISGDIRESSYIQIYGELRDESTVIDADVVVVDYQSSTEYIYMYGMSLLGGLLAVAYFFCHWRVNLRAGCFETREGK